MILRYFILAIAASILITASDPFFGIELSWKSTPKPPSSDIKEKLWMSTDAFRPYLNDYDNRVSDLFDIPPFFYSTVHFWFLIYTQFESNSVVIHDKNNLALIYKVLDFSSLSEKNVNKNTLYILQNKITEEKLRDLKNELNELITDPFSQSASAKKIYFILRNAGIDTPKDLRARQKFFANLRSNLRTQTGQKNFIKDGIGRSMPYRKFLVKFFEKKQLPKELLSIPFLESSFNPRAQSKANALGIWQFMPLISSYYVPPRTKDFDYRSNIGVASVAASILMKENLAILKSWDLAVTAYNSGTSHLIKTRRKLGTKKISLEDIIKNSDSAHFGFASKNFYSEFLALTYTLAYQDELFPELDHESRKDIDDDLRFYLSKCSIDLPKKLNPEELEDIYFHNHHTSSSRNKIPRSFILTSKKSLPKNLFFEINSEKLISHKPKEWPKFLKNQSCSTR